MLALLETTLALALASALAACAGPRLVTVLSEDTRYAPAPALDFRITFDASACELETDWPGSAPLIVAGRVDGMCSFTFSDLVGSSTWSTYDCRVAGGEVQLVGRGGDVMQTSFDRDRDCILERTSIGCDASGLEESFDPTVIIEQGRMVAGLREGRWRKWSKNRREGRQLLAAGSYRAGRRDGSWSEFDYGQSAEGEYASDLRTGVWITRNAAGQVVDSTTYLGGRKEGLHRSFSASGRKLQEGRYVRDRAEGTWSTWNERGDKILEMTFRRGLSARRIERIKHRQLVPGNWGN